jgi:hypothetical protein
MIAVHGYTTDEATQAHSAVRAWMQPLVAELPSGMQPPLHVTYGYVQYELGSEVCQTVGLKSQQ